MGDSINIRALTSSDIPDAMRLVFHEGWNQTEKDWLLLVNNIQNVCLAAELNGKIVGTATAINYENEVAWLGMVLVDKDYRGRGISKVLLKSIFYQLDFCESIKLDATPAGHPIYKKLGFEDEYLLSRMVNLSFNPDIQFDINHSITQIGKEDIQSILAFDKKAFGSDRSHLIKALISDYPGKCMVLKEDGQVCGFTLGREGNRYHQIGPVMAKNEEGAIQLVQSALRELKGKSLVVDVMDDKHRLINYLESLGFEKQRPFTRMYLKGNLFPGEIEQQYIISGPEFG